MNYQKVLRELIKYYKKRGTIIKVVNDYDKSVQIDVVTKFKKEEFIEDWEVLKKYIVEENIEYLKRDINYLVHNSLQRFLESGD